MDNKQLLASLQSSNKEQMLNSKAFDINTKIRQEQEKQENTNNILEENIELPLDAELDLLSAKQKIKREQDFSESKQRQSIRDNQIAQHELLDLQTQETEALMDMNYANEVQKVKKSDSPDKLEKLRALEQNYAYKLGNELPIKTQYASEQIDLITNQKNRALSNQLAITNKYIADEFNRLESNYKESIRLMYEISKPFNEFIQEDTQKLYQRALSLNANTMAEASQTNDALDYPIRGIISLLDSIVNMGTIPFATINETMKNGYLSIKSEDLKLFENIFGKAFDYKSYKADDLVSTAYDYMDKLSFGQVFGTLIESLPEMGLIFLGTGRAEKALQNKVISDRLAFKQSILEGKISNKL